MYTVATSFCAAAAAAAAAAAGTAGVGAAVGAGAMPPSPLPLPLLRTCLSATGNYHHYYFDLCPHLNLWFRHLLHFGFGFFLHGLRL